MKGSDLKQEIEEELLKKDIENAKAIIKNQIRITKKTKEIYEKEKATLNRLLEKTVEEISSLYK